MVWVFRNQSVEFRKITNFHFRVEYYRLLAIQSAICFRNVLNAGLWFNLWKGYNSSLILRLATRIFSILSYVKIFLSIELVHFFLCHVICFWMSPNFDSAPVSNRCGSNDLEPQITLLDPTRLFEIGDSRYRDSILVFQTVIHYKTLSAHMIDRFWNRPY